MVAASATSPLTVLGSGSLTAYWRFQRAVVAAQLQAWLPPRACILVDISGPQSSVAAQAAAAGHAVLRVMPRWPAASERRALEVPVTFTVRGAHRRRASAGRLRHVVADSANLAFLADGSVDGVIADDGALSRHLMAEDVAAEIARVLRPGGQLLASVDSLVLGMSILAEQHQWAQLTDLPQAEVVLVPWPDGRITRCFGPEQLVDLLTEAGLEVSWIRPRTVLSPSMVDHVLRKDPSAIMRLVRAELAAGAEDSGPAGAGDGPGNTGNESFGIYLLAAARKPGVSAPGTSSQEAGAHRSSAQGAQGRRGGRRAQDRHRWGRAGGHRRTARGLAPHPVALRLAGYAPGCFRTGLQAPFRDGLAAVPAFAVAAVPDALQRVHDLRTLRHRRGQHRVRAVRFGQACPHIRLVLREVRAAGHRPLAAQDRDGAVQVVARNLKTPTYGDGLHGSSLPHRGTSGAAADGPRGGPGCAQGLRTTCWGHPGRRHYAPPPRPAGTPRAQNHPPWARSVPDRCAGPS